MRRWGVLGISATHGRPGVHDARAPHAAENADDLFPRTSLTEGWTVPLRIYREPVATWRETAGAMAAALRLARALRAGEPGDAATLARLFGDDEAAALAASRRATGEQHERLAALVGGWLAEAGARPVFAWPFAADAPELALDAPPAQPETDEFAWPARSLYPELLTQLVRELAGG